MSDRIVHIYRLVDPRDDRTRFVGWTVRPISEICGHHVARCGNDRKGRWIRELLAEGEEPQADLLEDAGSDWRARASHWLARYRNLGDLLNDPPSKISPSGQRGRLARIMEDGRIRRRSELGGMGMSQSVMDRALRDGTLERSGTRGVVLATAGSGPLDGIAARWGGVSGTVRGVLCLHAAAWVHGLTSVTSRQHAPEVAVHRSQSATAGGLPVRIVRLSSPEAFREGVAWTEVSPGAWMSCTTPARTVADLFSPWAGAVEGSDVLALEALRAEGGDGALDEAVGYAKRFRYGPAIERAVTSSREVSGPRFG